MRLAAIADHRGRSATAIEMSVFFVDSENAAAMNETHDFTAGSCASFAPSLFPKQLRYRGYINNKTKDVV